MKILIDNGHGTDTPGKCSPDRRLLEYKYARQIAAEVVKQLKGIGLDAQLLVSEETDIPLSVRAQRANSFCNKLGTANVLLISIHVNAAGGDGKWKKARGWEAWTSPGQTRGDILAEALYQTAREYLPSGTPIRTDFTDGDADKEARFTILTKTKCAAVLTENLFQDNLEDVDYLLSPSGRKTIVNLHVAGILKFLKG
ncbi:MAG: N-acetylmuramoyl-L-alanine amidase [Clostridium sp.]|nr:N-acetylmuramoyl-L-alanine amidase [Prevotella sp.]MCM1429122.1 N-acetylmuramoyl-L-alanine amidase [Clostridium sp.]MCM1475350.1 N-acetylmuramoyl-L-alanine amidase [Muribaculaceae bacterium]